MRFDGLDAALEGRGQYSDFAYFFRDGKYTRFNWKTDREDFGYPLPLSVWGVPSSIQMGLDAAINGQGQYANYAYFFKGGKYARYNWVSESVDRVEQPVSAWKFPEAFLSGIDAALDGMGQYSGTTYFFKGSLYVRYRWASDTCEGPFDIAQAWHLPADFNSGLDAALNGGGNYLGNAYLFKDSRYIRYDWHEDHAASDYPKPIQGNWKHGVAIWANTDTALSVDRDARLREDNGTSLSGLVYPNGTARGQAGWDVGVKFNSLKDLATKLRYNPMALPSFICGNLVQDCAPLGAGQISRIAINAHGEPGIVALWGKHNPRQLNVATIGTDFDMRADLEAIRDATEPDATVMFVGCLAGKSLGGTALLSALSLLFPGRKIVAFTTVGFSHGSRQSRHGWGPVSSTEPGMRDTDQFIEASSEAEEEARYGPIWNDLNALPWAHEGSPHAKVALNGQIIRGADL